MNDNVPEKLLKPYNPQETEKRIYNTWEKSGFFNPDTCVEKGVTDKNAPVFSIVLPPPNVTGTLHMGSTLMLAIEDILVRFERMRGKKTLWIPGTDSAAIATQAVVEKEIQKKEGKSRYDIGRDELLRRIGEFVEKNKGTIIEQMRAVGASLDWSRYAYTMDEKRYGAVMEAFRLMYESELIYRGNRIVNWDPKGQTTISDDEIEYEERDAKLYTFKYSKDFPIAISTTRPETKVGDTAVAVHPDDERYQSYIGKEYDAVFCDVPVHVKIIADKSVDKDFGTGALGVTPAHSQIDWEIADRHNLERPQVINEYAKMTVEGRLNGKKTAEAREIVVEWLKNEGLLEKEDAVKQNVSIAQRTGGVVEPLPKLQWWVDVDKKFIIPNSEIPGVLSGSKTSLKEIMRKAVENGAIKFVTERYERVYYNWIDNLRPWCISRQIWFGHRIPVWYKGEETKMQFDSPGKGWEQDPDVLDTWFSSGLWTLSTLGWPLDDARGKPVFNADGSVNMESDLGTYHPTSLIETGYDILFFWVARMILMSGFLSGQIPFRTVYLHGLVRDGKGQKISKSLGNNIDPVDMGIKYGMDAVRLSLVSGMAPGTDSRISEDKIRGYKHFANKLWNITRFVLSAADTKEKPVNLSDSDKQIISEFESVVSEVTKDIEEFRLHLASEKLYQYVWHRFADVIIEESKPILSGSDTTARASRAFTLLSVLANLLRLLHPFIPFVTEELWSMMPKEMKRRDMLMVEKWPVPAKLPE